MITKADTAEILTIISRALEATTRSLTVDQISVATWHQVFLDRHVGHKHIVIAAIMQQIGSDEFNWGITPAQVVNSYKAITRRIAGRTDGWELMSYTQRQAILSDPAECDYARGLLTTAQYEDQRQPRAIAAGPQLSAEQVDQQAQAHGVQPFGAIGRMPRV